MAYNMYIYNGKTKYINGMCVLGFSADLNIVLQAIEKYYKCKKKIMQIQMHFSFNSLSFDTMTKQTCLQG